MEEGIKGIGLPTETPLIEQDGEMVLSLFVTETR